MKEQNEKMKTKQWKKEKGITLVVLVITIVILLILAGIAIASLTGDNGLFTRANQARQNTLDAQNAENTALDVYEDRIDEIIGGAEITGVDPEVTNPAGAIPTGATVIQGDASEGIVIRDEKGNEWVWVEVPKTTDVYSTTTLSSIIDEDNITDEQCTTIYNDLAEYAKAYRQDGYEDTFYSIDQHGFKDTIEYNEAKNNMLRSVYKNGGFWIGRYEVGIENNYRSLGTDRYVEHPIEEIPVIKVNAYPYNYVRCNQAQILCHQLSTGGKTSSLMFGIQWDLTCKFLETIGGLSQEEIKGGDEVGSTNWGNYSNSSIILTRGKYNINPVVSTSQWTDITKGTKTSRTLLTTGASEDTNKMNIYDFAGNIWEWTLETNITNVDDICVVRGGNYANDGSSSPVYTRYSDPTTYSYSAIGFRASLWD